MEWNKLINIFLIRWLFYGFIFYLAITILLYLFADFYIFNPPISTSLPSEDTLKFPTSQGDTISAVYLPNKNATYTILMSHGNSEDLSYLLPFLNKFRSEGFSVFAYDYRGYGGSTGSSTEKNAYHDIQAAYHYLTKQLHVPPSHIIAYGRSIFRGCTGH